MAYMHRRGTFKPNTISNQLLGTKSGQYCTQVYLTIQQTIDFLEHLTIPVQELKTDVT